MILQLRILEINHKISRKVIRQIPVHTFFNFIYLFSQGNAVA